MPPWRRVSLRPVKLVGIVGEDFPKQYIQLYSKHGIDLTGLQIARAKPFIGPANTK